MPWPGIDLFPKETRNEHLNESFSISFYKLHCEAPGSRQGTRDGLSGLRAPESSLLGLAELAMENTPESA